MFNTNTLREITIELTNLCPQACEFCSSLAGKDSSQLSSSAVESIIHEARDLGVVNVAFSGGEPLLCNDIVHFVELTSKLGMKPHIYSGGIVYTNNNQRASVSYDLIKSLKEAGVHKIYISIHASSDHIHNTLSGFDGNYGLVTETFYRMTRANIQVGIHFVVTKKNYKEIENVAVSFFDLGAVDIKPLMLVFQGRAKHKEASLGLSMEDQEELLKLISKLRETYDSKINVGCAWKRVLQNRTPRETTISECKLGKSVLSIKANGDVVPCAAHKFYAVGNINYTSLSAIWKNINPAQILSIDNDECFSRQTSHS